MTEARVHSVTFTVDELKLVAMALGLLIPRVDPENEFRKLWEALRVEILYKIQKLELYEATYGS